jgi:hypothetical protein
MERGADLAGAPERQAAPLKSEPLELGHRLYLSAAFPALHAIEISIERRGRLLFRRGRTLLRRRLDRADPRADLDLERRHLRARADVDLDAFAGELAWNGELAVRRPWGRRWRTVRNRGVIMRFCPAVGEIGGSSKVDPPELDDPRFGKSQLCTPAVLRIFVDERDRRIAEVGRLVKRQMFPEHPPFVFNTVACVGRVADGAPGLYTDPASHWFNVFFGFYEIEAPKPAWSRPFGYRSAAGIDSVVEAEDIARLGKSDWNWFSNWMYGVPIEHVLSYSGVDMSAIGVEHLPASRIGRSLWHGLLLRGVEVASAYESDAPGAARLTRNTIVEDVWRNSFGLPNPRPGWPESFIPTRIDAQVDMAYREDERSYRTLIFGGTCAADGDPAFLAAQMKAVREVIARSYAGLGFDPA